MNLDFSSESDRTLEIFRAGTHTAANGIQLNFTQQHLQEIADGYDPNHHEAPVVLGHPADNSPAYGWIKGLQVVGDRLYATLHQLNPSFVEAVKNAAYKKVSASFYTPESSANPKPGRFMLRHLGFLGAQPPAVKGLAPIQFSEGGDEESQAIAVLQYLERMAIDFGVGEDEPGTVTFADTAIGLNQPVTLSLAELLGILQQSASAESAEDAEDDESEETDSADEEQEMTDEVNNDLEQRAQELAIREQAIAIREAAIARQEMSNFLEGLYSAGQLTPGMAQKEDLVEFMLDPGAESLEFSESTQSSLDWFKGFLSRLPKQVSFAELPSGAIAITEPAKGVNWGADQLELDRRIKAYAKEHSCDYAEAMTALEVLI